MRLIRFKVVNDQPPIPFQCHDCPFMADRFVAVMFALPEAFGLLKNFTLCPIRPCEAADEGHLVCPIHGHGVVNGCTRQSVAPDVFARVEIGSGVNGDVVTTHPQVHVELVGVGGAGGEVCAAEDGAGVDVAEDVGATVGKTLPHPSFGHPLPLGEEINAA